VKILVVSAHYPPNFVSGGTLAPQRLAGGLLARGHEVSVYAGWLGQDRRPLDSWTDLDAGLVPVRWVVTTPWTRWSDRANYDNPRVAGHFARHVREVAPDVIHFHSLQSLGGRLLDVGLAARAKLVVTLHDFWWWCARQFLVTRDFEPCCPVVSCGVCPCERDRRWLERRNDFLARRLGRAHAVLAVSRAAAALAAANGVAPSKLRVEENALAVARRRPRVDRGRQGADRDTTLRLTYAGGPEPMKGVHVLLDAARQLADRPGWELAAYGVAPFVKEREGELSGLPVDVREPFPEDQLADVFATTDVLVVPSVARETYSLLTREALAYGVPVICSDAPGPAEVVEHEKNGLLVPAGQSVALAEAVGRLLDDPGLLGRLRAGCRAVPSRSLDDLVASHESQYSALLNSSPPPAARRGLDAYRSVGRVAFIVGIDGAPLRYRARFPAEALELLGVRTEVRHYRDPEASRAAMRADAVVVYRAPATPGLLALIRALRSRHVPVLFDVDDLIFDPELEPEIPALELLSREERALWLEGVRRYRTTLEACDAFIGSTEELCRHTRSLVGFPTYPFANGVGAKLGQASDFALGRRRSDGPLRLGYFSGTPTRHLDWLHIETAVAEVMSARPDLELWLIGHASPSPRLSRFEDRIRRLPFSAWAELPRTLRDVDVNLAPLQTGNRFNNAKSAIKWLEAALTATPTVASPTQPFREAIDLGTNGLLADEPEEWRESILRLTDDEGARQRVGQRARQDCLLRWSPHLQGPRYLSILESVSAGTRPASAWPPLVRDEPATHTRLEPYDLPASIVAGTGPQFSSRLGDVGPLVRRRWASLSDQGIRRLPARAFAALHRRVLGRRRSAR
jgi:glycosyltransferase involved in cell wall biosynthesis